MCNARYTLPFTSAFIGLPIDRVRPIFPMQLTRLCARVNEIRPLVSHGVCVCVSVTARVRLLRCIRRDKSPLLQLSRAVGAKSADNIRGSDAKSLLHLFSPPRDFDRAPTFDPATNAAAARDRAHIPRGPRTRAVTRMLREIFVIKARKKKRSLLRGYMSRGEGSRARARARCISRPFKALPRARSRSLSVSTLARRMNLNLRTARERYIPFMRRLFAATRSSARARAHPLVNCARTSGERFLSRAGETREMRRRPAREFPRARSL